jgi:hypothetical protein
MRIESLTANHHFGEVRHEIASSPSKEITMSVIGKLKEAAGFVEEELYEHGDSPESKRKAQEGRNLRNEGRIEDGKLPKLSTPGTGH